MTRQEYKQIIESKDFLGESEKVLLMQAYDFGYNQAILNIISDCKAAMREEIL